LFGHDNGNSVSPSSSYTYSAAGALEGAALAPFAAYVVTAPSVYPVKNVSRLTGIDSITEFDHYPLFFR
jgi:hypothetical protein